MSKDDTVTACLIWGTVFMITLFLLASCTTASITTPEGVHISYRDFHPAGQAVEMEAEWEGVGTLKTIRSNETSEGVVEAVVDAVNPLNI